MSRTGLGRQFGAVLEFADAEGQGIFASCGTRDFFREPLAEIVVVGEPGFFVEAPVLAVLAVGKCMVERALDVRNKAPEDLQIFIIETARKEPIERDLVINRKGADHFTVSFNGRTEYRTHFVDEFAELRFETCVLYEMGRASSDGVDGHCFIEPEEGFLRFAIRGSEIGANRITARRRVLQAQDGMITFEDHRRRRRGEACDLVRFLAREHPDGGLIDDVDAFDLGGHARFFVAARDGVGRCRSYFLPGFEGSTLLFGSRAGLER